MTPPFIDSQEGVSSVAFPPDGGHILFVKPIDVLTLWTLDGKLTTTHALQSEANRITAQMESAWTSSLVPSVSSIDFSTDGKLIVSNADGAVQVSTLEGKAVGNVKNNGPELVA